MYDKFNYQFLAFLCRVCKQKLMKFSSHMVQVFPRNIFNFISGFKKLLNKKQRTLIIFPFLFKSKILPNQFLSINCSKFTLSSTCVLCSHEHFFISNVHIISIYIYTGKCLNYHACIQMHTYISLFSLTNIYVLTTCV